MPTFPFHRPPTPSELDLARQSAAPLSAAVQEAIADAGPGAMLVAWFSDLHIHAPRPYRDGALGVYATSIDDSSNLQLAFAELSALSTKPDLLIFGGDIADSGCAGEAPHDEYAQFQALANTHLDSALPTLPVLGNHDHADVPMTPALHQALARHGMPDWPASAGPEDFYYQCRRGSWRFITLDSRQDHPLSQAQRDWLSAQLASDPLIPTVILIHRPWVTVGNWVDDHRLRQRAFFDIIDAAPCVKAVFSGHTHKPAVWSYRDKTHIVFPSVAYGIGEPSGWGIVVLTPDRVHSVFIKTLTSLTYDQPTQSITRHNGSFRRLHPAIFEKSMLFNPCLMPGPRKPSI